MVRRWTRTWLVGTREHSVNADCPQRKDRVPSESRPENASKRFLGEKYKLHVCFLFRTLTLWKFWSTPLTLNLEEMPRKCLKKSKWWGPQNKVGREALRSWTGTWWSSGSAWSRLKNAFQSIVSACQNNLWHKALISPCLSSRLESMYNPLN